MEWKQYNENYEVSNEGQVKNRNTGRILKPVFQGQGKYGFVYVGKEEGYVQVHRIVAKCFLPELTEEQTQIDHIDRDKYNNHASNLRWVTAKENCNNREAPKFKPSLPLPSTGERHISYRKDNNKYVVRITSLNHYSQHLTLDEAITTRNKILDSK